jgi:hypothetical protein
MRGGFNGIHVDSGPREERARIIDVVNAPRLNFNRLKARTLEPISIRGLVKGPGDTPHPELDALSNRRRYRSTDDNIRHGKPASRPQDTKGLTKDGLLVR